MTSAVRDGKPIEIGPQSEVRWRFIEDGPCGEAAPECPDGSKIAGNDGCNSFTHSIDVQRDTLTWGTYWFSTAVACAGDMANAMFNVFHADPVRYVVSGDELRLTSTDGTVALSYRRSDEGATDE
jgi:heat shock protein HslJ